MSPITTPAGPKGLYPDRTFLARDVVPDALIYLVATIAGSIEGDEPAVRVPYVAEDPTVGFVPEGAEITVDDPTLDEIEVRTGKLAVITRMSNEAATYGDANQLIANSLSRAVTVKGDTAFLSNPAVPGPPGLLNVPGIADGGTLGADLDAVLDAITAVEVNGGTVTNIVTDPASWGVIGSIKAQTGSAVPLLGAPAEQTERRLYGVPVVVSAQMPPGNLLVVDRSQVIAAVGPVKLATSPDVYFTSDSLARRVTWRIGWGVVRPDRLAKVSVTIPPPVVADDTARTTSERTARRTQGSS
ncbi:phage major capsid protein [Cellulomonas sp. P5_C5]